MDNPATTSATLPSVPPPSYNQYGGYPAAPNPNLPYSPPPSYGETEYPTGVPQPPYPVGANLSPYPISAPQPPYTNSAAHCPYPSDTTQPPYPIAYAGATYPTAYGGPGYPTPYEAAGVYKDVSTESYGPTQGAADNVRLMNVTNMGGTTSTSPERYDIVVSDVESGWTGSTFSDKSIRRAFIRKVFLILMAQLSITIGLICLFIFCEPIKGWVQSGGSWFYWLAYIVFLITYIVLVCCPGLRRTWPANIICLLVFTLALSYMAATVSCFHGTNVVLIAMVITAAVCLSLALFAMQTRIDFTMCSGVLFAFSMVLFFFGFVCIIGGAFVGYESSYILYCVYAALAALLFSLFLVYDIQMIMGGHKLELSPEEYIFGALQIYLDVVYLFLIILSLFGGRD